MPSSQPNEAPFFSTQNAEQLEEQQHQAPSDEDEDQEVPTFASTMRATFEEADADADAEIEQEEEGAANPPSSTTQSQGQSRSTGGRKPGAMKWNGLELRALLRAMDSKGVFDPTKGNDDPEHRTRAWLGVVDDLNVWNKAHPRKDGKFPVRTVHSAETKWRKDLYPRIKDGDRASEIATGPSEQNEEEELTDIMERLKEQWEECVKEHKEQLEAKRKIKDPKSAKSLDARSRATTSANAEESEGGSSNSDTDSGGPELKRRRGRGPAGANKLAGTVGDLAKAQTSLARKDLALKERIHNEQQEFQAKRLALDQRRLDLEQANVKRFDALEKQVQQSIATSRTTLEFLQANLTRQP
ncbi:hypothetical protein OC842_001338 [Tilletia horrida]|uniref:No apical meristem-associated C-terminal domain-containing protein n=1 Tax=Tilletia horrida TaxID=155126 RepID=A0AAN6GHQ0_9BASI|nr:hypothetical protein OC842_001338 [Tilletia horrida]